METFAILFRFVFQFFFFFLSHTNKWSHWEERYSQTLGKIEVKCTTRKKDTCNEWSRRKCCRAHFLVVWTSDLTVLFGIPFRFEDAWININYLATFCFGIDFFLFFIVFSVFFSVIFRCLSLLWVCQFQCICLCVSVFFSLHFCLQVFFPSTKCIGGHGAFENKFACDESQKIEH